MSNSMFSTYVEPYVNITKQMYVYMIYVCIVWPEIKRPPNV